MVSKDDCLKAIRQFRSKYAVEAPEANIVAAIHLMNRHGIDAYAALDQSSRSGSDSGVDAWHFDDKRRELFVYQSKLTESRAMAAHGFGDLDRARAWLEDVIIRGELEQIPVANHCLFNLYTKLSAIRGELQRIHFVLISPLDRSELEDLEEFEACEVAFSRSKLNLSIKDRPGGKLIVRPESYDLEHGVPSQIKTYAVERIPKTRIELRKTAHLDLAYLGLHSLVQLYRERGDALFDKNVRLSLLSTREAKERLAHPMEATLSDIVAGKLKPIYFHVLSHRRDRRGDRCDHGQRLRDQPRGPEHHQRLPEYRHFA